MKRPKQTEMPHDPLWFKDGVIYELHVRAFCDSDADGVGDFRGLAEKLDYLKDLGVTAIWLLPFCRSPLRDDGYDISDYTDVHPVYGTLRDFQNVLKEAHRRGLRVITELVLNHTSDQHPWFQRARRAQPGSRWRDFYVWSDTADKYRDARIIFKDFESSNWTWDPVARAYYWHRFYSHQPDLNYESPYVRADMLQVVDFWFDMGIDGLRLDAVPYLYEKEGTSCENLPETHMFLKELRSHVDARYQDRVLIAEANQWPEEAVAYFGNGDECHMAFHFPLMPRLFMAQRREDRFPIIDILEQTPSLCENCQWALFLRNHDELTLEMVTDEERDYMYRAYAHDPQMRINLGIRRRLAPLLGNHRRRMELMNALLFSLPGTPIIYYGDEIGMGDNIYLGDRNGVRTPMQWNVDRNSGFSRANPQRLYLPLIIDPEYHYEAVNVEAQQNNPHSWLWWMKRLIALRKQSKSLARGAIEFLHPQNRRVLAFLRQYENESTMVIANLSRFVQPVELDLARFRGLSPVEMFGRIEFPPIGDNPYFITLAPHSFYWFTLEPARVQAGSATELSTLPVLQVQSWDTVFEEKTRSALLELLPGYLKTRPWFRSKTRTIRSTTVLDFFPVISGFSCILLVAVEYSEGERETYSVLLSAAQGHASGEIIREHPESIAARLRSVDGTEGILYEALYDNQFCNGLLNAVVHRKRFKGRTGELIAAPTRTLQEKEALEDICLVPLVQRSELQANSSVVFGNRFVLKVFRRLEPGINPDLELGRFLTEQVSFGQIAPTKGILEFRRKGKETVTVGVLHGFIPNHGDAWKHTIDSLSRYLERALAHPGIPPTSSATGDLLDLANGELPQIACHLLQNYMEDTRILGQRTAELHLALSSKTKDPSFALEPFSSSHLQGLYHGMISLTNSSFEQLRQRLHTLPQGIHETASRVLHLEPEIRARFRPLRDRKLTGMRMRHHGDYHLGQVLWTGKDYIIIDFEGEPGRPLSERRIKRSPLRDVAGMIRSFHYASSAAFFDEVPGVTVRPDLLSQLQNWVTCWYVWVSATFLKHYLATVAGAAFIPKSREEIELLLNAFLLEKAIYEVGYELDNRPRWVGIPLQGVLNLLRAT